MEDALSRALILLPLPPYTLQASNPVPRAFLSTHAIPGHDFAGVLDCACACTCDGDFEDAFSSDRVVWSSMAFTSRKW